MPARFSMLLLVASIPTFAQTPAWDEYQVKAAYIFNFAKFVEWPTHPLADSSEPIRICIAGQSPVGSVLGDMVQGKKIGDRPLVVQHILDAQQAAKCQILFIGAAEKKRMPVLLEALKGSDILTVGESDDFIALGGLVGLRLEGKRVCIRVCLEAVDRTGLRISSKLLGLVEIVKGHK